jgi:hypothetical protein
MPFGSVVSQVSSAKAEDLGHPRFEIEWEIYRVAL